jgi:hypothetical protein
MHANAALLNKLFDALGRRDHETMASCYHQRAHFRDIAFSLRGRQRIHDMWRVICEGDSAIEVRDFEVIEADDDRGCARVVEHYTFQRRKDPPGHRVPVDNRIVSRFRFENGKILRQDDECDAREWARQALGEGLGGFLAGRIRLLRWAVARGKLRKFVKAQRASG